jgi:tRNA 2-thiouridine synthesizing protein A
MKFDVELDASGLRCPLPMLRTKKKLLEVEKGRVLKVISTDPGSRRDFEAMLRHSPHELLGVSELAQGDVFFIRKG